MKDCNYFGGSGDNITLNLDSKVLFPMINSITKFIHENHPQLCGCLVTKSCLIRCDPMDCSPPGSSTHGIFQARILEWGANAFSDKDQWIVQNYVA